MEFSFDILREAWVNVLFLNGDLQKLSILELLKRADEIKEIKENGIFEEYGIYQFLIAFLTCALDLENIEDKVKLIEQKKFDIESIKNYITLCEENRPNCFNLFGDNPFYQNSYTASKLKAKEISVSKLDLYAPSGRNSVHFFSEFFIDRKLNYEECAKMLVSYLLFQPFYDGPNTSSGPTGQIHPLYFILKGFNLFDTLLFNIITKETWGNLKYYTNNVVWAQEPSKIKKEKVKMVSLVEGLTFQNRHLLLGKPDNINQISNIYITAGKDYDASVNMWQQPNCAYMYNKERNQYFVAYPREGKRIWMDTGKFFNQIVEGNLRVVKEYNELMIYSEKMQEIYTDVLEYDIYYCICKEKIKTPILKYGKYSNILPFNIIKSEKKVKIFSLYLLMISNIASKIKSINLLKNIDTSYYYDAIELNILSKMINELERNNEEFLEDNFKDLFLKWGESLRQLAINCLDKNIYALSILDSSYYKKLIIDKRIMISEINKLILSEKLEDDELETDLEEDLEENEEELESSEED